MNHAVCAPCCLSCHWAPLRRLWLCLLIPPITYSDTATWYPRRLSLLQAEESQNSQPFLLQQMFQSLNHLCGPFLYLLQYVHVCLALGSPELNQALWMCFTSLNLLAMLFLMQSKILLAFFVARTHCSLMIIVLCTPRSFSLNLPSVWSACSLMLVHFPPLVHYFALPFAESHDIPFCIFFQPSEWLILYLLILR